MYATPLIRALLDCVVHYKFIYVCMYVTCLLCRGREPDTI